MKQTSVSLALLSLAAGAFAGPVPQVQRQSKRDVGSLYASYSTGATIPFTSVPYDWNGDPLVSFTLNDDTTVHTAPVDTGSSAYLIGSTLYPGYDEETFSQKYTAAVEYLSSSYRLYTGYWVPTTINFKGQNGQIVTSQIDALVVKDMVKCFQYDQSNPGQCPSEHTKPQCTDDCKMNYMGIGFGRSGDGQGEDTPDKNAMLNIKSIGDQTVSNFRTGYIVSDQGITVGLTSTNTENFNLVKLGLNNASTAANDWKGVTGCVTITDAGQTTPAGSCVMASILLDSGIDYSYLTLTPDSGASFLTESYSHLPDNTKVSITFGEVVNNAVNKDASFTFTQSSSDSSAPSYTLAKMNNAAGATAFINTGSHFYRGNDIMYDAVGGYWGIRARS